MSWFKKQLDQLREKPYQTKIKILWTSVAVVSILIITVWIITINARDRIENSSQPIIEDLKKNLDRIKNSNPFKQ